MPTAAPRTGVSSRPDLAGIGGGSAVLILARLKQRPDQLSVEVLPLVALEIGIFGLAGATTIRAINSRTAVTASRGLCGSALDEPEDVACFGAPVRGALDRQLVNPLFQLLHLGIEADLHVGLELLDRLRVRAQLVQP